MDRLLGPKQALQLALLACTLTACSPRSPWQHQKMISCAPAFKSSKLTLVPPNLFTGIGVEVLQGEEISQGFFNIYTGQLSTDEGVLWIDSQPICFKGTLMEGKQRLLLPSAITRDMMQALTEGRPVIASIQGYTTELSHDIPRARERAPPIVDSSPKDTFSPRQSLGVKRS